MVEADKQSGCLVRYLMPLKSMSPPIWFMLMPVIVTLSELVLCNAWKSATVLGTCGVCGCIEKLFVLWGGCRLRMLLIIMWLYDGLWVEPCGRCPIAPMPCDWLMFWFRCGIWPCMLWFGVMLCDWKPLCCCSAWVVTGAD